MVPCRRRHIPGRSPAVSIIDDYLSNNAAYALTYSGPLSVRPSRHLAVVACMDSRLKIFGLLGMGDGESHVIRNAGGVVTDDVIRSLAISQRLLGTTEIALSLIHISEPTRLGMISYAV